MKRPKLHNNPLSWVETKQVELKGVRLSDIQFVPPSKLKANPLNVAYFKEESSEYFDKLRNDIKERGIIVPLVAKTDDTLLAGHNRLRVARELGLDNVPVQYVLDVLPEEAERGFIIKDNLYRRHFATAEWIELYKKLYPNFDEQIQQETRGGGRKWTTLKNAEKNVEEVQDEGGQNKTERSVLLSDGRAGRITAEKIAKDTGQKISAVQKQLTKYRKETLTTNNKAGNKEQRGKTMSGSVPALKASPLQKIKASEIRANGKGVPNTALVNEVAAYFASLEKTLKTEQPKTIQHILQKVERFQKKMMSKLP
jgi:ParB-like chromosome segregation protein Spo0J